MTKFDLSMPMLPFSTFDVNARANSQMMAYPDPASTAPFVHESIWAPTMIYLSVTSNIGFLWITELKHVKKSALFLEPNLEPTYFTKWLQLHIFIFIKELNIRSHDFTSFNLLVNPVTNIDILWDLFSNLAQLFFTISTEKVLWKKNMLTLTAL